jgi:hypothetical protein
MWVPGRHRRALAFGLLELPEARPVPFLELVGLGLRCPTLPFLALFTRVRGETVWKFGIGPESGSESGQEGSKESRFGRLLPPERRGETPSAIFQTVSEGEFSEVRIQDRA